MFKSLKIILVLSITLISLNLLAATQTLLSATNDNNKEKFIISVAVDEKFDITALHQVIYNSKGEKIRTEIFKAEDFHKGFVLLKRSGRKAVKLISKTFSTHQGGVVVIDYLYSGITGSRRSMEFDVFRNGDDWVIEYNGKSAKKLHFVSNKKMLIGTIGVKKIIVK